eukprot:1067385-Amphidinium_carterae.2
MHDCQSGPSARTEGSVIVQDADTRCASNRRTRWGSAHSRACRGGAGPIKWGSRLAKKEHVAANAKGVTCYQHAAVL